MHEGQRGLLAVRDVGAYGFSMASNYNLRPRAAEVLVEGGAARLVRWALVKDYGKTMPYRSPEFKSFAVNGRKAGLDDFGPGDFRLTPATRGVIFAVLEKALVTLRQSAA